MFLHVKGGKKMKFIPTSSTSPKLETELLNCFSKFNNCLISVGFLSEKKLKTFESEFKKMASKGQFELIYGWTRDTTKDLIKYLKMLNVSIKKINPKSGIYISEKTFHGKVYSFSLTNQMLKYI